MSRPAQDPPSLGGAPIEDLCDDLVAQKLQIDAELGRGGMGRVLRAKDVDLNRDVALKVLAGQSDPSRFMAEAQITGQLDHPNVIPVHEFGVSATGEPFFTMKLVRGHKSLREVIELLRAGDPAAHAEFSFERRAQIVQRVCDALEYAHKRGVIHRDVKPDNVLVGPHGEVYVVDWGVAKVVEGAAAPKDEPRGDVEQAVQTLGTRSDVTRDGASVGTLLYMPPEQALGKREQVGPWSDLYSLTAVLYELLSLHHYLEDVEAETPFDLLYAIVSHPPKLAERHYDRRNGRVPRSLSNLCKRGLSKRPSERWGSAAELREAIQGWLEGRAPVVCPGTLLQRILAQGIKAIDRFPVLLPLLAVIGLAVFVSLQITLLWRALR